MSTPVFSIERPGMFTTVQDLGRYSYRHYGVPVSGALDKLSMVYANVLVGNKPNEAVLEVIGGGFKAKVLTDTIVAVTGAEAPILLNGSEVRSWTPIRVSKGDVIEIGLAVKGFIIYIGVFGGIDVPLIMDSRSTYTRARFGGLDGRTLKVGDIIHTKKPSRSVNEQWSIIQDLVVPKDIMPYMPSIGDIVEIRVTRGQHEELFTEESYKTFYSSTYIVTPQSDRMGYRLDGPAIKLAKELKGGRVISLATPIGSIQIPPDGKPIILLPDCQTTGGYAIIATVIPLDVDKVAQCKPGVKLKFKEISISEAEEETRKYLNLLENPPLEKLLEEEEYLYLYAG